MKPIDSTSGFLSQYEKAKGYKNMPIAKQWDRTYNFLNKEENKKIVELLLMGKTPEEVKELCLTTSQYARTVKEAIKRKILLEQQIELEALTKFLKKYPDVVELLRKGISQLKISEETSLAYATVNKVNQKNKRMEELLSGSSKTKKVHKKTVSRIDAQKYLKKYSDVVECISEGLSQRKIMKITGYSRNTIKNVFDSMVKLKDQDSIVQQEKDSAEIEIITAKLIEDNKKESREIIEGLFLEWKKTADYNKTMVLQRKQILSSEEICILIKKFKLYLNLEMGIISSEILINFEEEILWKSTYTQKYREFKSPNIFPLTLNDWNSAWEYYRNGLTEWKEKSKKNGSVKVTKAVIMGKLEELTIYLKGLPVKESNEWIYNLAMENLIHSVKNNSYEALKKEKQKRKSKRALFRKDRIKNLNKEVNMALTPNVSSNLSKVKDSEEKLLRQKQREIIEKWEQRKKQLRFLISSEKYLCKFLEAGIDPWRKEWDSDDVPEKYQNLNYKGVEVSELWLEDRKLLLSLRRYKISTNLKSYDEEKACSLLEHLRIYHCIHTLDDVYAEINENSDYPNKQMKLKF